MTVFVGGREPEDIFCGIYDAWMSRLGHDHVRLEFDGCDRELFCEYRQVKTTAEKAAKVTDSIQRKISRQVYEASYKAALSRDENRADRLYRFLVYGFQAGAAVMDMLQVPAVNAVFSMNRYFDRELDHMLGFVRFSQTANGILFSEIAPENDLLVLMAPHFAERLPQENWMIYDCRREKAAVYQAGGGWGILRVEKSQWQSQLHKAQEEAMFEQMWTLFHRTVSIKERENRACQQNHLPLRYRPYMTEWQEPGKRE